MPDAPGLSYPGIAREAARQQIRSGVLDPEVLERAAEILKIRSSRPGGMILAATRNVLTRLAGKVRDEASR